MGGKFYIYEHWRPDRDECFYVGLGRGNRATSMSTRNRHHKAIQAKLSRNGMCVEVRVVAMCLNEEDAKMLEIERIAFWRADGADLANLTSGGDGVSNPSEETRAKMRAAKIGKGKPHTAEHAAKIAAALTGKKLSPEHAEKARKASLGRKQPKDEIERRRVANLGKKRSDDACTRMSAAWTPERKAAQAIRMAEMNRSRSMKQE